MLVKHHAMAQHMRQMYHHYENHVKTLYIDPCKAIAITQDAWTSPHNAAFLSLTGHFITNDWELVDVTLGIAEIKGDESVD